MSHKKELCLELRKLRHRHTLMLFLMTFAIIAAWMSWCLQDLDLSRTNDASALAFSNLLLMNTILCPVMEAALASQMCDMEQIGNTYKWLCTIQNPEHIYRGKAMAGGVFMAGFSLMQTILFRIMTAPFESGELAQRAASCLSLFSTLFLTSLCIFILQLNLSLWFSNQLTPVFISIGGTFMGLFSWFLNRWPLRYLIPWGYYAALCNTGFLYDEEARYTACYWDPYPILWAVLLAAAIAALYCCGQRYFLKMVRETM